MAGSDDARRPDPARSAPGGGRPQPGRPPSGGPDRGTGAQPASRPTGRPTGPPRGGASREQIEQRTYDPRREERRKATRIALPDDVEARMLDPEARRELRSLSKDVADLVARHLVVTGQLLDGEPERALSHARAARALAGRVAVVREAAGLASYAAGEWAEALAELRAARRISGRPEHLGVMADCERALGRPERALAYADDPQLSSLTQDARVELVIVLAGARRDLGQHDAAVLVLQEPARRTSHQRPWAARLWYAYADALLAAGREVQAREWFAKAAAVDVDGQTDAGDRLLGLEGVVLDEPDELEGERTDLPSDAELAELVKDIRPLRPGTAAGSAPAAAEQVPLISPTGPTAATGPVKPAAEAPPGLSSRSGVAPPPFAAPPAADDPEAADRDEPRLFD